MPTLCHVECKKCTKCKVCNKIFPESWEYQGGFSGHTVHIVTNARAKVCALPPDIVSKIKS